MAMANNKRKCFTCHKENNTYTCEGCLKRFCSRHIPEHQQKLNDELSHIIIDYDQLKQKINEQNRQNHSLINQIDQWEMESIEKIQQKAQSYREIVIKFSETSINDIEIRFNDLNKQIQQLKKENDFNEINLNYLKSQLMKLTQELNSPLKISIKEDSESFINEISIIPSKISKFSKWKQNAITVAGGNGQGHELNQLDHPFRIFIDKKKNIFIADGFNHRIVEWRHNAKEGQIIAGKEEGEIVVGGNGKGNQSNQLNNPSGLSFDNKGNLFVVDRLNHQVGKFEIIL
ncbi:unnamed protein product [Adineta steineri]|uniref:Uncharacterized protein n=1 Tax=Adineta steineri TaxID=433720 RepID=A0A815R9W6_9BILA|nr:unnamed protein product [Adineta steineri]CAF1636616.1 unnamed protein product [Adineta steineri]